MKQFFQNRTNLILVILGLVILLVAFLIYQKVFVKGNNGVQGEEAELNFDPEGPYGLLVPRKDGNAANLILKRTASYEAISYELAYVSEATDTGEGGSGGIDRGVVGTIDTAGKKGEYEQEILFGTCSKNVCKYDKGVENGTLILHITKGKQRFRMTTLWHLQNLETLTSSISSGDGHFNFKASSDKTVMGNVAFSLVNDLTGVPKLPAGKKVLGKVYALNVPSAKELPSGEVKIELGENSPAEAKVAYYKESRNEWKLLETKVDKSGLTAQVEGAGLFTVLVNSK